MALKFRRGTTAQKSGSLAFGEPYVNSTLGTLQIGGQNGDITLLINSSSTGISGSSLDITGNAKIDGDLTLGGKITIGDASSDTVNVIASLSSSLIPSETNAFDLGSSEKIWRDLYISTGSIKFVNSTGSVVSSLSTNTVNSLLQSTGSIEERLTQIGVVSGSLISSASAASISITNINSTTASLNTSVSNINTFSGSQLTQNTNLATITGSLIASASSFETRNASLATISGSLISTASVNTQRLTAIETVSGSWVTEAETASFARTNTTNVFTTNQVISGGLDVTGTITANEFHTTYVSSSVMYNSGSNRFGDSADDLQQLIGIVEITGSIKGTQFNDLATITGSLIASASSFESRNASLATITGSLISSASSFESRNASLATITGSLISTASNHEQRITANESISSSYARTNLSNTFNNDQTFSGSIYLTGRVRAQLAISASAVNINTTDGNSQLELVNSTTGRGFHLISYDGDSFSVHAPTPGQSVFRIDSGSQYHSHFFGDVYVTSGSILVNAVSASAGFSGSVNGIGNVTAYSTSVDTRITNISSSLDILSGSTYSVSSSLDTRITNISSSLNTLSGSTYTMSSSLDTRIINVSSSLYDLSGSTYSVSSSLDTRIVNVSSSLNTLSGSTYSVSSSLDTRIINVSSSLYDLSGSTYSVSSSLDTRISNVSASLDTLSGSTYSVSSSLDTRITNNSSSIASLNTYTGSLNNAIQLTGSTVSFLGNIVVYGTQSVINSQNVQISDNILYLSPTASIDNDLGVVGHYNDGTYRHAGIFMDASDGHSWKVFNGLTDETSAQVDVNGNGFTLADFKAGVITGTSFNGTINATNGVISGSSQVNLGSVTGNSTSNVTEGTNLYYLDSRVKTKLNNEGVVSGSSQISLGSASGNIALSTQTTGDYVASLVAGTNITLSNNSGEGATPTIGLTNNAITIAGTSTSLGGTISAATIGNAIGAFSGSAQVAHDSTTGYSANRHIDHTAVTITAGSGLSGGGDISATRTLSIATGGVTDAMLAGSISNAKLTNSTISGISLGSNLATLTIGTGLSGTSYNGSTGVTIANTGVTSNVAGTGISLSGGTGAVTITNSGVTSLTAGTGVSVSGATGGVTVSIGQSVATSASPTFAGLTINGAITATGDITAYYTSDKRHKNNIQIIPNALSKVRALNGVTWEWNDDVNEVTKSTPKTGLIAQEVQSVLPEVVIEKVDGFLGLDYSKMMGLMVEAIKEQQIQIDNLTLKIAELEKQKGL
jgi:hypothetical protein